MKIQPLLCWAGQEERWRTGHAHSKLGHLFPIFPIEKVFLLGLKPGGGGVGMGDGGEASTSENLGSTQLCNSSEWRNLRHTVDTAAIRKNTES